MKIGFIGLGNMGSPMAINLSKAGHDITGFDIANPDVESVSLASTATAAATGQDTVITMLPDGDILCKVAAEILPAMRSESLLIDCSTVDVASARAVAADAAAAGIHSVDAPVSGGIGGAQAGTLTFMAGGSPDAFALAEPLFDIMGARAVHCGEAGAGQAAKICNNMLLGISMLGTCEAFAMAGKLGLDPARLFDVVSTSSGSCWSVNTYCPVPGVGPKSPSDNEYIPGFAADLMLKDLRLSQTAAQSVDAPTPMGARATELYEAFLNDGGRGKDFSAVYAALKKDA